ncbi:alpha/beta fold hydrolase [Rhodoblastus sp. 17X3]|uniref:alpha/beta fold hydrolase n=1 Tax=Rhodoblastus sp. 17X3 TaxID=3047026 RepID=UPI0024B67734|nr:alpha/beta fold hydrolase [Rhodoblastus sp. 17X3]MDI9847930.1 alpha/beta fold hydrolase [Rhodoblastus sp. 17X3]
MAKFFVTVRSVDGDAFGTALGAIRYLIVPDGEQPRPSHRVGLRDWIARIMASFQRDAKGSAFGDALFFVHGYNTGAADVDVAHRAIVSGLAGRMTVTVISFDWPSADETFAYLPDLDIAKRTAIDLVNAAIKPLLAAQTQDCRVAIHALCHSMGAYVLREALDHADDGIKTGSGWTLNQLALIGGDVDANDFVSGNKDTESMLDHAYRLTNYFNRHDEVLQISNAKWIGVAPRLGRVGLPPDAPSKTVNVNCSAHFETLTPPASDPLSVARFSHSWYFTDPQFYADLAQTLIGAQDRLVVAGRGRDDEGNLTLGA